MLNLSRKADYALIALSELARRLDAQAGPISARELAGQFGMPEALLMNVLKDLGKAKLVESTRGVRGGYEMAIEADRVSVVDVVTAVDGPIRFAACAEGLPIVGQGCQLAEGCPIRGPVLRLHRQIVDLLESTTVADLVRDGDALSPEPTMLACTVG